MGHHHAGDAGEGQDVLRDLVGGLSVQCGGGFVRQQDGRLFEQCTSNGNALLFAAGKLAPAFAAKGIQAAPGYEFFQVGAGMTSSRVSCGKTRNIVILSRMEALKTNTFCWTTETRPFSDSGARRRMSMPSKNT